LPECPFPPLRQLCEAFESELGVSTPEARTSSV
jgi:hypothetical protein